MKEYQLCGLGNAIVDIFVTVDDKEFASLGFERGTMRLVDLAEQRTLLERYHQREPKLVSGGSVANSVIAFSQLGGQAAFIGCVGDDRYGLHYKTEFDELDIDIGNPVIVGEATGTCVALITPDAERTMRTCLAVSSHLAAAHVDAERIQNSEWLFIEGYVFANPETGQTAIREALRVARAAGTKVAVTCSEAFIANVFGDALREALEVTDLFFANESEACAVTGAASAEAAFDHLRGKIPSLVVTDGPRGAFIRHGGAEAHVEAFPCEPRDLTGAGDMFAGAFLYGLTHNVAAPEAARGACFLAMKVISQVGARLHHGTRHFWDECLARHVEEHHRDTSMNTNEPATPSNFIHQIIDEDNRAGAFAGRVHTRFPPEPNGYLHIGHAKSICLNFGTARKYGGKCNLRFDDTNPTKEETEYVDSIMDDVRWLGFEWDGLYYASDYFQQLHDWAVALIQKGKAYVCDLNAEQTREYRGTLTKPGKDSPYRTRSVEENLDLFARMKKGEFPDGTRTLRARIDMASPNFNLRDPVMYRILHAHHHRSGDQWCIYPMYDWAHGQSDSIERITHSICTLEFENHRPLYDWCIQELGIYAPRQIEFARLNLTYTIMSKRKLLELVQGKHVQGWDDPRMPTLSGIRRRGYTAEAVRSFCERIGVSKFNGIIDMSWLEDALREDLNKRAPRVLGVLRPLRVILTNYPEGQTEEMDAVNNPENPAAGSRKLPFSRELYIEQDDFREDPPKQFFRLGPGREVRLRWGYFVKCDEVVKDAQGNVVELRCTYDPATRGGNAPDGRKVKGTIHWVSAAHAVPAEVRLYDHLFSKPNPDDVPEGQSYLENLNPRSLEVLPTCYLEPSVKGAAPGTKYQFERLGYFCVDKDSTADKLVVNRAVTLHDALAKLEKGKKK